MNLANRFVLAGVLSAAILGIAPRSEAQVAQSTFASSDESWTNITLPYPSAVPATILATFAPTWVSSSGGYLTIVDPDGGGATGNCQYWRAPDAFHGNLSSAYNGTLSFDLANSVTGFGSFHQEDLLLVGNGMILVFDLAAVPTPTFQHFVVPMTESGWKKNGLAGPPATETEFRSVLLGVEELFIRAEHQLGQETQYLDNVVIAPRSVDVAPRSTPLALAIGNPTPNPSHGDVRFTITIPRTERGTLEVYGVDGRRIRTLARGTFRAGVQDAAWNGRDVDGRMVSPGLYWLKLSVGDRTVVRTAARVR